MTKRFMIERCNSLHYDDIEFYRIIFVNLSKSKGRIEFEIKYNEKTNKFESFEGYKYYPMNTRSIYYDEENYLNQMNWDKINNYNDIKQNMSIELRMKISDIIMKELAR